MRSQILPSDIQSQAERNILSSWAQIRSAWHDVAAVKAHLIAEKRDLEASIRAFEVMQEKHRSDDCAFETEGKEDEKVDEADGDDVGREEGGDDHGVEYEYEYEASDRDYDNEDAREDEVEDEDREIGVAEEVITFEDSLREGQRLEEERLREKQLCAADEWSDDGVIIYTPSTRTSKQGAGNWTDACVFDEE